MTDEEIQKLQAKVNDTFLITDDLMSQAKAAESIKQAQPTEVSENNNHSITTLWEARKDTNTSAISPTQQLPQEIDTLKPLNTEIQYFVEAVNTLYGGETMPAELIAQLETLQNKPRELKEQDALSNKDIKNNIIQKMRETCDALERSITNGHIKERKEQLPAGGKEPILVTRLYHIRQEISKIVPIDIRKHTR